MATCTNNLPQLNIDDIYKALSNTTIYMFRYFPKERILVNDSSNFKSLEYGNVFCNIPYSIGEEYIYEADKDIFYGIYEKIHNNEPTASGEFRTIKGVDWCRITLTTTRWDENNNAEMCVGIFENRSDFMTLESQLKRDNAMTLEKRGIGTWRWENEPGKELRLYLDKIARDFFGVPDGLTPEENLKMVDSIIHPDDAKAFAEYSMGIVNGNQGEHTYRIIHAQKGIRYIRCNAWYDKDYKGYGCIKGIHDDVTEQVQEDQKKKEALINAFEAAKRANQAKTTFLSNMSHDIRTPMNAITGFASIAYEHLDDSDKVRDCLSKILTSSEHLQNLINQILDMSRIESGKVTLDVSQVNISELTDSIFSMMSPLAKNKNLDFKLSADKIQDVHIYADILRLRQILINIIGNAIKFTNEGGWICFTVEQLKSHTNGYGLYRFVIKDNGIGMSEEFQTRIFEPFEREKNTTVSGITGTGLGMAITKSLVDMMNGSISVRSRLNEGCEFTIDLEFKLLSDVNQSKEPEPTLIAEENKAVDFTNRRLLLVEDNELNRELATEILSEAGFIIEPAINGKEAVDILSEAQAGYYDLVLMDIQMPVMNGYEATIQIRTLQDNDIRNIPIIAMTANAFAEDIEASAKAGMNDHIAKPFNIKKLLELIGKYIK